MGFLEQQTSLQEPHRFLGKTVTESIRKEQAVSPTSQYADARGRHNTGKTILEELQSEKDGADCGVQRNEELVFPLYLTCR